MSRLGWLQLHQLALERQPQEQTCPDLNIPVIKLASWLLASPGASVCLSVPAGLRRASLAACDLRLLLPSLACLSHQAAS